MSPQTPAQKRAKQTLRTRKVKAYAIIRKMYEQSGESDFDEFLARLETAVNNKTTSNG